MTSVVVMAGGRGQRLHPLTETCPKPLLRVGSKPLLEQVVDHYRDQGVAHFVFCLGYLHELITRHFGDGSRWDIEIDYLIEETPLGTGGALTHARDLIRSDTFLVTNCDVIAPDLFLPDMMAAHRRAAADATVAAGLYQYQVPYGVIEERGGQMVGIREKPIENFMVNAGIYMLGSSALQTAPAGPFDMPDFIESLPTVAVYPIKGYWADVGTFESMARANQEIG